MKQMLWMGLIALSTSGCGELSYKRGASAQDLEVARTSCLSAGSEKALDQCLENHGWAVKHLDDIELFAVAGVTPDHRNPAASNTTEAAVTALESGTAVAEKSGSMHREPSSSSAAPASRPDTAPPPPASPLDVYTVNSWWKVGAGRDSLESDTGDCVTTLGVAHRPDHKTQQVTRGLVICMHGKGWKALREK